MDEQTVQENPTLENTEKEKSLESINSLSENLAESRRSNRIVARILLVAAVAYIFVSIAGFTSPLAFPILFGLLGGNQIYTHLINRKWKKLNGMKEAHESQFGAIPSAN